MALRPAQRGFRMRTNLWKGKLCVDCAQPLSPGRRVRADAGHLSGGVADMVRQGMGRCAKTVPASTSDLLALDQHACAIQPANTPLYAAGPNSKPCPAPLLYVERTITEKGPAGSLSPHLSILRRDDVSSWEG
ncbi:hypothetical protein QQF64_008684, partial [Cirrhinus molitorella]